jgi:predicted DsbA family dithiol-disulfide isomerase
MFRALLKKRANAIPYALPSPYPRKKTERTTMLTIDIVSDAVCPWCFIGKRHLDTALAELSRSGQIAAVQRHWHPFLLDAHTPTEGEPYGEFMLRKFADPARVSAVLARVRNAGREAGIDFAFDKIALRPNTLRAHRLLHRCQLEHKDNPADPTHALAESLFQAHFIDGQDIGDLPTLAALGAPYLGIPAADLAIWLAGEQYADAVLSQAQRLPEMLGIGGVPFFIINGSIGLSGAQPPRAFIEAITQALAEQQDAPPPA